MMRSFNSSLSEKSLETGYVNFAADLSSVFFDVRCCLCASLFSKCTADHDRRLACLAFSTYRLWPRWLGSAGDLLADLDCKKGTVARPG